jgi:hypothetical protein
MQLIAHRGNIYGPSVYENSPDYIKSALNEGYCVEVDVRLFNGQWYLGHDEPCYPIDMNEWIKYENIFWHAKDVSSFSVFISELTKKTSFMGDVFYHFDDYAALTFRNYLWCMPDSDELVPKSNIIIVHPEKLPTNFDVSDCAGVCSDYIFRYKMIFG